MSHGEATFDAPVEAAIEDRAEPVDGPAGLEALVDDLADRQFVLLGEASHGTAEFYRWRARLTAALLQAGDFGFVAVEGDWPDCRRVDRYVRGEADAGAGEVLRSFDRWPTWMWANHEAKAFVEWLREYNAETGDGVGFFGMDVYSLFESIEAVVDYLEDVDPEAAEQAHRAAACFEPHGRDAQEYAQSLRLAPESCEDEVVELLSDLRERRAADGDGERFFDAEQNALTATHAEQYYRGLVEGDVNTWNLRDRHMKETLDRLVDHRGGDGAIVWAHNTHVGDARATSMPRRGDINVGQLVREDNPADEVGVVGFGSYEGEVIAADRWDAPPERLTVPRGREGSWGAAFHEAVGDDCLVRLPGDPDSPDAADDPLAEERGHRAIGVVYHPSREGGNYVPTRLADRYDAFVHVEESGALHPLEEGGSATAEPETYPWGL